MQIGVDVGGSHIGLGLVEKDILIDKAEMDYKAKENNMENIVLETIRFLVQSILETHKLTINDIEQIGIAFPGTVSNGVVIKAENLGIENFEIEKKLKEFFNTKIVLENDAKCAAIAEKENGSLKEYDDALFLIIGTGVGGAAFLEGKLLKPKRYSGFEVGHMAIKNNKEKCNCGSYDCFEIYGSMKRFKEKISKEFNLNTTDGKTIKQFIIENKKNEKLEKSIQNYIEDLTIGIANLINIFEPEAISIGGSFAHYKEILLPRLEESLKKDRLYNKGPIPKLLTAELKNDAGIIGAAMIK